MAKLDDLLKKHHEACETINQDRGFREGGRGNVNELTRALKVYGEGIAGFGKIAGKLRKDLGNCVFDHDLKSWLCAYEKMTFEKFEGMAVRLKRHFQRQKEACSRS